VGRDGYFFEGVLCAHGAYSIVKVNRYKNDLKGQMQALSALSVTSR